MSGFDDAGVHRADGDFMHTVAFDTYKNILGTAHYEVG